MRNVFPARKPHYLSATCVRDGDVQVYKALKARAELHGVSLARMVLEACREYLAGGYQ